MTVASTVSKSGPYTCDGATTLFNFAFACQSTNDVEVILTSPAGVDAPLAVGAYGPSLNADQVASPGGTVNLATAPASGYQLTVVRNVAPTQGASIPNGSAFYPKVVENALDKLTMLVQQITETLTRTVQVGVTSPSPSALVTQLNAAVTSATTSASSASSSASSAATTAQTQIASGATRVTSPTGKIGYTAGAGNTVTQTTSKSTAVTLDRPTGRITMHNAALAAGASVTFQLNNSIIGVNDVVITQVLWGSPDGTNYRVEVVHSGAGAAAIKVTNISAGSLSDALVIKFVVLGGAQA